MPKRQRVPRYSIVAAEDESLETLDGDGTTDDGKKKTYSTSSRRRSSAGAVVPPAATAASLSTPAATSSPNVSRTRKKIRQKQAQELRSSSALRKKEPQAPKRQKQQRRLAAEEILLQLFKVCEKHRSTCHPNYDPRNTNRDSNIPPVCESAIANLRMLIPKLESTIASSDDAGNKKIISKNIVQLCRFYDNVVRGTYCPHLPHIFGVGTNPETILDKVFYLLRNSLNIDLEDSDRTINNEQKDRDSGKEMPCASNSVPTAITEYLDVVSQTISGLLASIIDDSSDHIRQKLFVDWIGFLEDLAILSTMRLQINDRLKNVDCLPVNLVLFEESSYVIKQRCRERQQRQQGNCKEQTEDDDNSYENYTLSLQRWEHIWILQGITFNVLSILTSNESALQRLETYPEQQGEESLVLLGGDVDLFFPFGLVTDIDLVSSLLASLKPVVLMPSRDIGSDENNLVCIEPHQVSATALEILLRVCHDWHRLGIAMIAIPLLSCMVDVAVLTTRVVHDLLLGHRQVRSEDDEINNNRTYDKRLVFLLDRIVCRPPGYDTNDSEDIHSFVTMIHSAVWTVLLDCIEGIAIRLRLRRQRKIQKFKERQVSTTNNDGITTAAPSTSASSIILDLAVLDTIHFIASTSPSLALDGSNYCTARGIFPHLFLLSSTTSLATCINDHNWSNDLSLLQAATKSLAVFIHASSARDANDASLLESICLRTLECRGGTPKLVNLEQLDGIGQKDVGLVSTEKDIDGEDDSLVQGNNSDGGGDAVQEDCRSLKRKRQSSTPEQSDLSVSMKRRKSFLNVKLRIKVYPLTWYDAMGSFLDFVLHIGENLNVLFVGAASQSGTCDEFEMGYIIEQIRCLSGGLQLVLSLIRKIFITAGNESVYKQLSGISRIAHELSKQLVSCCKTFLNSINTRCDLETSLSYAMADAILRSGISMHFSKLESQKRLGDSFTEYIGCFLDSVSSFSGRLLELGPRRQFGLLSCRKYTGIPEYLVGTRYHDHFEPQFCLHLIQFYNRQEQAKEYVLDKSITILDSLPLFVRAALMTSLHPVHHNLFPERSKRNFDSLFDCYSLDLFTTFFKRYLDVDKREPADLYSSKNISSLLHLLPLIIKSLVDDRQGKGMLVMRSPCERDNQSEESKTLPSTKALLVLLKNGLSPIIQSLKSEDNLIFQSLVSALGHIHSLITDTALGISTQDPSSVLELLLMRHIRLHPTESKKDVIHSTLRGMMIDIVNKGVITNENPVSRYFLWMCGANYCISASPSEIRQQIITDNLQTAENDFLIRDGVLPWLVSAPFSDPNSLLRKFISRELSTVLISKDYSFLLSRFASSDEFKEYYTYSCSERKDRSDGAMYCLVQMADDVVNRMFEEIDGLLNEGCSFSEAQLSLPFGRKVRSEQNTFDDQQVDNRLTMQQTAARTLASLCHNTGLNHPIGKTLFEKGSLRLIRMWAAGSTNDRNTLSFPELQSTPIARSLAFGRLACLSGSRNLSLCLSGEISWTYFPSATFNDVLILNGGKIRREQYELLERMVCSFFVISLDSLHKRKSAREASKLVTESIPSTIAQLVNVKDEETIQLIIGFNIFLMERYENYKVITQAEVHVIGTPDLPIERKKSLALSMGSRHLQKKTKDMCLKKIDKMLPLVLFHSDHGEALPLKFFTTLTAPVTLADMMAGREQLILKGISWELGRDPYRVGPAVRALKTAAIACGKGNLDSDQELPNSSPGTNAATLWVTKNFMYLIVNMVQLNWGSRKTAQQVQALRCLHVLLDFLNSSEAPQYFPQVLSTVNAAITVNKTISVHDPDDSSLCLHAVQCLSKFIRLSTKENIQSVIDNLTTIVVSLLPILEEEGTDEDETQAMYQEARIEAVSILEFLTRAEFVRKFPKAFSQIPFLPTSSSLGNVHKSLRDNGINFDNLLILSTTTSQSQAGTHSRRESLTSEITSHSTSSASSSNGDNVLALQNRISLVSSLLFDENASVRKVALQHLADLLRANRNLFHMLVENERGSLMKNYLTLIYGNDDKKQGDSKISTTVTVSNIIEKLMQRCVHETDRRVRLHLATCLGEIGAIGEHRLDDISLFSSKGSGSASM